MDSENEILLRYQLKDTERDSEERTAVVLSIYKSLKRRQDLELGNSF